MKLSVSLFVTAIVIISFMVVLHVKTDVQILLSQRNALMESQQNMREDLRVMEAEFALLSSPERLRTFALSAGMKPMGVEQILPVKASYFWGG